LRAIRPLPRERDFEISETEEGIAQLGNYSAGYITVGDGEPVVLVPGLAGSYELLGPFTAALARRHKVISYRLRGDGCSRMFDRNFRFSHLADDLDRLIRYLRLERPTVVGLSFGAAIALEYATRFPGRLGRLVVSGGATKFVRRIPESVVLEVLSRYPLPHDNPFVNQFFRLLFGRNISAHRELLHFVTHQCWQTDQSVIAHRLRLLEDFDVQDRLWSLATPTLVIAGQYDAVIPPVRQKQIADGVPQGDFSIIEGGGHLCFLTNPVIFARQLRRFLARSIVNRS